MLQTGSRKMATTIRDKENPEMRSFRIDKAVSPRSLVWTLSFFLGVLIAISVQKRGTPNLFVLGAFIGNWLTYLGSPTAYKMLAKNWGRLAQLLHHLVQPIVVGILFYVVFLPIGLAMRFTGKDNLNLKYRRSGTLWRKPSGSQNFRDQF